jgi:transcriptional regulator with XRE-family HTH domain
VLAFSQQALGQVVRGLREHEGLTQAELGSNAGYGAGAGVAISRLESGQLLPGPEKLEGIARALGLTVEQLERRAAEHSAAVAAAPPPPAGAPLAPRAPSAPGGPPPPAGAAAPPGQKELNLRSEAVTSETSERARVITELSEAYNQQYDRARASFLLPFDELGARLDGAPRLDPAQLQDEGADEGDAAASVAAAGPSLRERAERVASGRAGTVGIAGLALAGIALMPAAALLGGGLVWKVRRDRRQRQELAAQLDEAEAALAASKPGVEALEQALPRATATLDYIATHAGHALARWSGQLDAGPLTFAALAAADQRRYHELLEVAAAQIAIATLDFQGLLTTTGTDRDWLVHLADQVLTQAQDTVQAHV